MIFLSDRPVVDAAFHTFQLSAPSLFCNEDAERGLLCSLLLAPGETRKHCENLPLDVFYVPAHRIIYEVIGGWAKPDQPIDFPWLRDELKRNSQLDEVGGKQAIDERTIWILQHASDDVAENRVVVTCCKNNDGELGPRSAWIRDNGLWMPAHEFDWDQWDNPNTAKKETGISELAMKSVFENGGKALRKAEAVDALIKLTGKKKSACYNALKAEGLFADQLHFDPKTKLYRWIQ